MDAAKEAGADSFKLQIYNPSDLAHARGGRDKVITQGPWAGRTLIDIYTEGALPVLWLPRLFLHAKELDLTLFASVFDWDGIQALRQFDCAAAKIASFELRDLPLIRTARLLKVPMILSTGMARDQEISDAYAAAGGRDVAVLHCVSAYPCPVEKANLKRILHLRANYPYVGFSDHTLGNEAAIGAVALGACIIEKHLTLSRDDGGLDAAFSSEPKEFASLVKSVRATWEACQGGEQFTPYKDLRSNAA
jgi:N-acetylneuraminate synthase